MLDFLGLTRSTRGWPRWAPRAPTTSCAPRSSRWCSTCPRPRRVEDSVARLRELHAAYREDYQAYYDRHATADSPAIRGADPLIVLVPGVGMFSFGKDKQTARVAGEFYVNAINVMRGAEGLSTYAPIDEAEKFRIEYWALEEAKLQRMPKPKPLATRIALVTGAAVRHRQGHRHAARRRGRLRRHRRPRRWRRRRRPPPRSADRDVAVGVAADVSDEDAVQAMVDATVLAFGGLDLVVNNAGLSLSKSLLDTTVADWDLQHDVMAKGSFLVSKAAARVLIDQRPRRRHRLHLLEELGLRRPQQHRLLGDQGRPGPPGAAARRRARRARHQGQRHQPRRRRPRAPASSPAAGAPTAPPSTASRRRTSAKFYAQRTLLKREVLPEHVANAVFALCGPDLTHTTGLHVPVDAGVAAAFLR